jgi:cellulose synthase (UDP-forming)
MYKRKKNYKIYLRDSRYVKKRRIKLSSFFRIQDKSNTKYYYALDPIDASLVRVVGVLGIAALIFLIAGFVSFLHISLLISLIMAPVLTIIVLFHFAEYFLMATYPGFDIQTHRKKVIEHRTKGDYVKVAILIAAAGEDNNIVRQTIEAALAVDYKYHNVYVLDDTPHKQYKGLAKEFKCNYINRPNPGEYRKAGNLNYARKKLPQYDYYLVLDADFIVKPEILRELTPYVENDVGIIQSPQHFNMTKEIFKRSKIEYGAAFIQRDFYRITQVARNKYDAAICVGTNALYSREALEIAGGFSGVGKPDWGHSEDVHTGLKIINSRNSYGQKYRIFYIPVQLAIGYCPASHHSFYKQQNRWATGSMQIAFSRKTLFSKQLTIFQKICYFSNSLYYFYCISFLITPLYLLVITLDGQKYNWKNTLLFIPMLLVSRLIGPYVMRGRPKYRAVSLVVLSNAYTFLQALILIIIRKPLAWEATGASAKGKSKRFTQYKIITIVCFIMLYLFTIFTLILNKRIGLNASILVTSLFIFAFLSHLMFLNYLLLDGVKSKRLLKSPSFYTLTAIILLTFFTCSFAFMDRNKYHIAVDKSRFLYIQSQHQTTKADNQK